MTHQVAITTGRRVSRAGRCLLLLVAVLPLDGCASTAATSGDPAPAAQGYRDAYNYLPVNDLPPDTHAPLLTVDEQLRLRAELDAAREKAAKRRAK